MGNWRRIKYRMGEPIVVDRSLDVMVILLWATYGTWGILAAIGGISTLDNLLGIGYSVFWGAAIGLSGWVAALAAMSVFVAVSTERARIYKKQVERWAVSILGGLISVYPILSTVRAISGDVESYDNAALGWSYLVVITWRIVHLVKRIRALKVIANG